MGCAGMLNYDWYLLISFSPFKWRGKETSANLAKLVSQTESGILLRGNETVLRVIRPHPINLWLIRYLISKKHGITAEVLFLLVSHLKQI